MPGPSLVESRIWELVTAPPADGDDVAIASGAAPLRANVLQRLYARDSYLLNGPFHGYVDPSYQADITASGTNRTWTLRTAKRIAIRRADGSGIIDAFTVGGSAVTVAIGVLGANSEAFVYAWNDAGVLKLEVSSTLPEPSLDFLDSDLTRVYLGSFLTDGAGRAVTQVQRGRDVMLVGENITGTPTLCGSTAATGATLVPAKAPSIAKVGVFRLASATVSAPSGFTRLVSLSAKNGLLVATQHYYKVGTALSSQETSVECAIVDGQIKLNSSQITEVTGDAYLLGWRE